MQWSVRINEARQRLKDPVRRATYLCELHGQLIGAENNTAMPADFLMQQMQWREALDEADDVTSLQALADEVQQAQQETLHALGRSIDQQQDYVAAAQRVRRLMFVQRFAQDNKDPSAPGLIRWRVPRGGPLFGTAFSIAHLCIQRTLAHLRRAHSCLL